MVDDRMKVVQFHGSPGSGKTYILEKVQNILEKKGYTTFHLGDKYRKKDIGYREWLKRNEGLKGRLGSFLIEHLPKNSGAQLLIGSSFIFDRAEYYSPLMSQYSDLISSLMKNLKKIYSDDDVGKYINMFLELLSIYEYAKKQDIDIYLTDEQFSQKLLMYFSQLNIREHVNNPPSRKICEKYLINMAYKVEKYVDLNISIQCSPEIELKRQEMRKQPSLFDGFSYPERLEEHDKWNKRSKKINEIMDVKSFIIDNGQGKDESQKILNLLNI